MRRRVLTGGLAGGLALFVWGLVAWMIIPYQAAVLRALPAEDDVVATLEDSGTERGLYLIPGPPAARRDEAGSLEAAQAEWDSRMRRGPVGLLVYQPGGTAPNRMFRPLVPGFLLCVLASTFASWALLRARIPRHGGRILFVAGLGLFSWLLGPGAQWIWFHYPVDYAWVTLVDALIGWLIVAVVLAGIVRP